MTLVPPSSPATLEERLAHACQLTVFSCGDWRFSGPIDHMRLTEAIERIYGLGVRFDQLILPGGPYGLAVRDEGEVNLILDYLGMYFGLHGTEQVALVFHTNCGRIAHEDRPESPEHEGEIINRAMCVAMDKLLERFGTRIKVTPLLAIMDEAHVHGIMSLLYEEKTAPAPTPPPATPPSCC